jgi:elongation factor G
MKVKADFGSLEISYRECCTTSIEASTAMGDNAAVSLSLEPRDDVANEIVLKGFPADVHDTISTIVNGSLQRSPISGHPIINTKVTLTFQNCGPAIDQVALIKSVPQLITRLLSAHPLQRLEPVMRLVVECPSAYAGAIMNDLHSRRRGSVHMHRSSETDPAIQIIEADAPLAELLGYSSYLRSASHGHASLILEPDGFQPCSNRNVTADTCAN